MPGSGEFSNFRKITGPDEIGERLDDAIEILKEMAFILDKINDNMDRKLNKKSDDKELVHARK